MFRLLASLLLALTLALSPLAMKGGMAMAHSPDEVTAASHCPDMQPPADQDDQSKDKLNCMSICSAVAADQQGPPGYRPSPQRTELSALASLSGVPPESETPPPRPSPEI